MNEMFWLVLGLGLVLLVQLILIFKEVFKKLEASNFILARSEIKLDDIVNKLVSTNHILDNIRSKTYDDSRERMSKDEYALSSSPTMKPKKKSDHSSSVKDDLFV